jgi:SAM-dependent methyltransferase
MTATATVFDPVKYKQTTRAQWQDAAEAWYRWEPTLSAWLGSATEMMLDMAGITAGSRVLDVAAGAGEQTIRAARRVRPGGYVVATDIAPNILACAEDAVRQVGLTNVETRVMDGESLELEEGAFDAVISRVGLIYFPDQHKALTGMHRVLKPGGTIAAIVYSTPENNRFFSIPVSIIRRRAQLPPPLPGQPRGSGGSVPNGGVPRYSDPPRRRTITSSIGCRMCSLRARVVWCAASNDGRFR